MRKLLLLTITAFLFFSCTDTNSEKDIADETILKDGFYMYDGYDSASGRHRINIYACSEVMSEREGREYIDVLLWIYSDKKPEVKPDGGDVRVKIMPTGPVSPFYTDGRELPPLVYYVGATGIDENGLPNMTGSGWVTYKDGEAIAYNACEFGQHNITYDSEIKMYTISGTMTDTTNGKELKYKFTSDKDLIEMIQG